MAHQDDENDIYRLIDCTSDDFLQNLTSDQRLQIERHTNYAAYPTGHVFYSPGEQSDQLLIIRTGRVRLYKLSPEGRALTLFVLEPQAIFGETALAESWQHDCFAEAMSECVVGTISRVSLRELLSNDSAIALRLMDIMGQRLRTLEQKLADIAFKSVPQRLATVLLSLADCQPELTTPQKPPAVIRYTHQQLAEMIGSYRETVTKVVSEFREAGLIHVDEESIYLTDIVQLRQLAGR